MKRSLALAVPLTCLAALIAATSLITPGLLEIGWSVLTSTVTWSILLAVSLTIKACTAVTLVFIWGMDRTERCRLLSAAAQDPGASADSAPAACPAAHSSAA